MGEGRLQRSHVGIGKETFHNQRTSKTAWYTNSEMSLKIQRRAFDLVRIPYMRNQADAIQVIRYEEGQLYLLHTDYFAVGYDTLDSSKPDGTNRIVTIFMYLSDVEGGGHTVFPHSKDHEVLPDTDTQESVLREKEHEVNKQMHACDLKSALKIKPKKGRAVLFYNQLPDGSLDHNSEHGGCPVASGRKWAANVWIRNRARPRFDSSGKQIRKSKRTGSGWFFGSKGQQADSGPQELKIEFSNERTSPIEIFWKSPNEGYKSFGVLDSDMRLPINTFAGHEWLVKDKVTGETLKTLAASNQHLAISI